MSWYLLVKHLHFLGIVNSRPRSYIYESKTKSSTVSIGYRLCLHVYLMYQCSSFFDKDGHTFLLWRSYELPSHDWAFRICTEGAEKRISKYLSLVFFIKFLVFNVAYSIACSSVFEESMSRCFSLIVSCLTDWIDRISEDHFHQRDTGFFSEQKTQNPNNTFKLVYNIDPHFKTSGSRSTPDAITVQVVNSVSLEIFPN